MTKCPQCGHYYANRVCYYCAYKQEREAEARSAYKPEWFMEPSRLEIDLEE
jgi:hypothetical protein